MQIIEYLVSILLSCALLQSQPIFQVSTNASQNDGQIASFIGIASRELNDTSSILPIGENVTMSSSSTPAAALTWTPIPILTPSPTVVHTQSHKKVFLPVQIREPQLTCSNLQDDQCNIIDEYNKCGFCILDRYPLKGYGCPYKKIILKTNQTNSNKLHDFETVLTPLCECEGQFINNADGCSYCMSLIKELVLCAQLKQIEDRVQIPISCLEEVGVSQKALIDCGFLALDVLKSELDEIEEQSPTFKPIIANKQVPAFRPVSVELVESAFKPIVTTLEQNSKFRLISVEPEAGFEADFKPVTVNQLEMGLQSNLGLAKNATLPRT